MAERAGFADDLVRATRVALRRMLAGRAAEPGRDAEHAMVTTGLAAIVAVEKLAGSDLVIGRGLAGRAASAAGVANDGDLRSLARHGRNVDGDLATAFGLALGGARVAAVLAAPELVAGGGVLAAAVRQRVPLLVHALTSPAAARAAVDAGAVVLWPANATAAVDLTVAGRRLAEEALVPVVVLHDRRALAEALQDVLLPDPAALARRLGAAADTVHAAPGLAADLFGDHRRRVPRWHDAGRAVRLGAIEDGLGAPAALLAAEALAAPAEALDAALAAVGTATGRPLLALDGGPAHRGDLVIITAGTAAETVATLAHGGRAGGRRVTALAVSVLAPFPAASLRERVAQAQHVVVLERQAQPGVAGPLERAVAGCLPGVKVGRFALAGSDGQLRAQDLVAACERVAAEDRSGRAPVSLVLGAAGGAAATAVLDAYPKLAARQDLLIRQQPALRSRGAHAAAGTGGGVVVPPTGAVSVALVSCAAANGEPSLGVELGALLHAVAGGHLRSRLDAPVRLSASGQRLDRLIWSAGPLADLGDEVPVDLLVCAPLNAPPAAVPPTPLAADATVLLVAATGGGECELPRSVAGWVGDRRALLVLDPAEGEDSGCRRERALGALFALVAARAGLEVNVRKLRAARAEGMGELDQAIRERRLAALEAGLAAPRPADGSSMLPANGTPSGPPALLAGRLAASVAGGRVEEGTLGSPLAFWEAIGNPLADGAVDALFADPLLAVGALPAHSAPRGTRVGRVARLEPTACTGCGVCWSVCPHAAIEARVIAPVALLDQAMARAARAGASVEGLRRFAGKIAARLGQALAARSVVDVATVEATFLTAGEAVLAGAGLDAERLGAAQTALAALAAEVAPLPLVAAPATAPDLLVLAIDADRCTACELCVPSCEPGALGLLPLAGEQRRALWAATAATLALPAPPAATLERLRADGGIGPLAAALLVPEHQLVGGSAPAETGSGARLALAQLLALAGHHLAPARRAVATEIDALAGRLAAEIHAALARAVPDQDLAALARGLDQVEVPAAELSAVAERLAGAVDSPLVDVARLRRLVEAARAVADLAARLGSASAAAAGHPRRAPLSLVLGDGEALAWARRFPDNPFAVPAVVATEAPLELARGLALAEAERAVAEARVLRRARLELDRPGEALAAGERLGELRWEELEPAERALATPIVAVLDERSERADLTELTALLASGLPLAVVTLAALPPGERTPAPPLAAPSPWATLAFALPIGTVAHATVAHPQALDTAAAALAATGDVASGGALVRLLAPVPSLDGVGATEILVQARGAVEARAFPLGCRFAAACATPTAPRFGFVDPLAAVEDRERAHAAEVAALTERHRAELGALETELRRRLAAEVRQRLLALLASGGAARAAGLMGMSGLPAGATQVLDHGPVAASEAGESDCGGCCDEAAGSCEVQLPS